MKRFVIALSGLTAATAASGATPQRTAWFMKTIDGKQWCAFTSEAKARQAGASDRFESSETAWMVYRDDGIVRIVVATESEDAYTEDSYAVDKLGRATRVSREGHYIENPPFRVTFAPGKGGKMELTSASRSVVKAQEAARNETYFVNWPLYASLASMPFRSLIQTKSAMVVSERCIAVRR